LQREGDQIAKTTFGHRVLVGEKAIIGIQSYLVAGFHRSSENYTAKFSGDCGRDRSFKEYPNMAAVS
jgi:hypothetical protein